MPLEGLDIGSIVKDVFKVIGTQIGGLPNGGGGGTPGGSINEPNVILPGQGFGPGRLTPALDMDPRTNDPGFPASSQVMDFPEIGVRAVAVGRKVLVFNSMTGEIKCCPLNKPRRMNPLNPCAARRAMRRLTGLKREMNKVDKMLRKLAPRAARGRAPARRR